MPDLQAHPASPQRARVTTLYSTASESLPVHYRDVPPPTVRLPMRRPPNNTEPPSRTSVDPAPAAPTSMPLDADSPRGTLVPPPASDAASASSPAPSATSQDLSGQERAEKQRARRRERKALSQARKKEAMGKLANQPAEREGSELEAASDGAPPASSRRKSKGKGKGKATPDESAPVQDLSAALEETTLEEKAEAEPKPRTRTRPKSKRKDVTDDEEYASEADSYTTDVGPSANSLLAILSASIEANPPASVDETIERLFQIQRPSKEFLAARTKLVARIKRAINQHPWNWGWRQQRGSVYVPVVPFGSSAFDLMTANSDLDLCIIDQTHPGGFGPGDKSEPELYNVREIAMALRRHAGIEDVTPIPYATVPICKFVAEQDGFIIEGDLTVNERFGPKNSALIEAFLNFCPIRPLATLIKTWAKQRLLNDPSGRCGVRSPSSYSWLLLLIAYLQSVEVLPVLQNTGYMSGAGLPKDSFWSSRRGKAPEQWDMSFIPPVDSAGRVHYRTRPTLGLRPGSQQPWTTEALAIGFFEYYGSIFPFESAVVTVRHNSGCFDRQVDFSWAAGKRFWASDLVAQHGITPEERQEMADKVHAFHSSREVMLFSDELAGGKWPTGWDQHRMCIQDPFMLSRNTAGNVGPMVVARMREEMQRAAALLRGKAPLTTLLLSAQDDRGYQQWQEHRKSERARMRRNNRKDKEMRQREKERWEREQARILLMAQHASHGQGSGPGHGMHEAILGAHPSLWGTHTGRT